MSKIINIPQIMINSRENGLFIKNWANNMDMYHSCGHGSHGKIEPIMAIMHSNIQIIQQTISIFFSIQKYNKFCVVKCS